MKTPKGAEEGTCSASQCGRRILWIKADGKDICVDPVQATIYQPHNAIDEPGNSKPDGKWISEGLGYISHFKTCPAADQFSKSKP